MTDKIHLEILADGTISVQTDGISSQNHKNADEFLDELEDLLGGDRVIKKRPRAHAHVVRGKKVTHTH